MVLDSLRVSCCSLLIDPKREQKSEDDLVTSTASGGEALSGSSQSDRLISLSEYKTFSFKTFHDPMHRYMTHTESLCKVCGPTRFLLA